MSSVTVQGQFRLAPVVMLIQDASGLYNLSVFLMNTLHSNLLEDMLEGHRERFSNLFSRLKKFYNSLKPYGYFEQIITIPTLPNYEPRFKSAITHQVQGFETPNEAIAPPIEESFVNDLIDITTECTPPPYEVSIQQNNPDVWMMPTTSQQNLNENMSDASLKVMSGSMAGDVPDFSQNKPENQDVWQLLKQKDELIRKLQDDIIKQQIEHNNEILQMQKELMEIRKQLN